MSEQRLLLRRLRPLLQRLPHLFPFLFAALTVTALVASNPHEGIKVQNLRVPAAMSFGVVVTAWVLLLPLCRDRVRGSLATTAVALPTLLSGYLFGYLRRTELPSALTAGIEVSLLLVLVVATIRFVRAQTWPPELPRFLTTFGILGLMVTAPVIVSLQATSKPPAVASTDLPQGVGVAKPDIYLVVLDAYTGIESLKTHYEFDNAPFVNELTARGFSIPTDQRSNYIRTFLSVGSLLNRDYLFELVAKSAPRYRDRSRVYYRMEFSRTVSDLKSFGYDFYYVGSSYPPLASNRLAVEEFSQRNSREFERFWLRSTALPSLRLLYCRATGRCRLPRLPFEAETASETVARLGYLNSLAERPGPKLVIAHLLLPHEPYRFGPECEHRPPSWTVGSDAIRNSAVNSRRYIAQLECTNQFVLEFVDSVQQSSGGGAIIMLQSDHGDGRFVGLPTNFDETALDQIRERFDIFAAYKGPGALGDSLATSASPVNLLRTMFRVLWRVDEPPLNDRHFWSERDRPLLLTEVRFD